MNETKKPEERPELNEEQTWSGVENYLATAVIEQAKSSAARNFKVIIILSILLAASVAGNIGQAIYNKYVDSSYDYVSQDGEGINNINTGEQGDLLNGAEGEN